MFILKSTHERLIGLAKAEKQAERDMGQRTLDIQRSINKSLRAEIEAMTPDYELGKRRRELQEADNAKRKAARAAK